MNLLSVFYAFHRIARISLQQCTYTNHVINIFLYLFLLPKPTVSRVSQRVCVPIMCLCNPPATHQQLEALKTENQRLKDENGALIRVISKLSR